MRQHLNPIREMVLRARILGISGVVMLHNPSRKFPRRVWMANDGDMVQLAFRIGFVAIPLHGIRATKAAGFGSTLVVAKRITAHYAPSCEQLRVCSSRSASPDNCPGGLLSPSVDRGPFVELPQPLPRGAFWTARSSLQARGKE